MEPAGTQERADGARDGKRVGEARSGVEPDCDEDVKVSKDSSF